MVLSTSYPACSRLSWRCSTSPSSKLGLLSHSATWSISYSSLWLVITVKEEILENFSLSEYQSSPSRSSPSSLLQDRKSTRLNSSHDQISYAVFCLKKKKNKYINKLY